jgi:hypothetical protein
LYLEHKLSPYLDALRHPTSDKPNPFGAVRLNPPSKKKQKNASPLSIFSRRIRTQSYLFGAAPRAGQQQQQQQQQHPSAIYVTASTAEVHHAAAGSNHWVYCR